MSTPEPPDPFISTKRFGGHHSPIQPPPPPPVPMAPPPPPYGYGTAAKTKSWMNVVSLVAVGVSLFMPVVANIAGIVFGHMGIRAADRGEADYRGVGLAGLILNYVIGALMILGVIAYIAFIVWAMSTWGSGPYYSSTP